MAQPPPAVISSAPSAAGAIHSFTVEERRSFSEHLNQVLANDPHLAGDLPLNPHSNALFDVIKKGVLLCKFINTIQPGLIPEQKIAVNPRNQFEMQQNHTLALEAARTLGMQVVNLGPNDLMAGTPHLCLGLTWQLIRLALMNQVRLHMAETRTMQALAPGENPDNFLRVTPEQNLLRWFNFHLRRAGSNRVVTNFGNDLRDSECYTLLLSQIAPGACNRDPLREPDLNRRAELMLQGAGRIGCRKFVQPEDVVAGNPKLNLAFTAYLFTQHPGLQDIDAQEAALRAAEQQRVAEEARRKADEDAKRAWAEAKAAEEAQRRQWAEAEARRLEQENIRRLAAEEEARRRAADEEARRRAAEAEIQRIADMEARRRAEAEEAARRAQAEAARLAAEAEARRRAEEQARAHQEAERQRLEREAHWRMEQAKQQAEHARQQALLLQQQQAYQQQQYAIQHLVRSQQQRFATVHCVDAVFFGAHMNQHWRYEDGFIVSALGYPYWVLAPASGPLQEPGSPLVLTDRRSALPWQFWDLDPYTGNVINRYTRFCMDIHFGSYEEYAPVSAWPPMGQPSQFWWFDHNGYIVNDMNGLVLGVPEGMPVLDGAPVVVMYPRC